MRASKLRHQIIIERSIQILDDTGEIIYAWVTIGTLLASVAPINGREYFAAQRYSPM